MEELVKILNDLNLSQESTDWDENIPEDIYGKFFENNHKEVASGLDLEKHRWYETSTIVIEINGKFLGINLVTDVFSENMDVLDCGEGISFFEMQEVKIVSYKQK
jgi:hypothetical protein